MCKFCWCRLKTVSLHTILVLFRQSSHPTLRSTRSKSSNETQCHLSKKLEKSPLQLTFYCREIIRQNIILESLTQSSQLSSWSVFIRNLGRQQNDNVPWNKTSSNLFVLLYCWRLSGTKMLKIILSKIISYF